MPGYFTGMITRTAKRGVTTDEVIHRIKWSKPAYFYTAFMSPGITDILLIIAGGIAPKNFLSEGWYYHVKNHEKASNSGNSNSD